MFGPTISEQRSPLVTRRSARIAIALAAALATVALTSMPTAAGSTHASPRAEQGSGTSRFDSAWVYSGGTPAVATTVTSLPAASGYGVGFRMFLDTGSGETSAYMCHRNAGDVNEWAQMSTGGS